VYLKAFAKSSRSTSPVPLCDGWTVRPQGRTVTPSLANAEFTHLVDARAHSFACVASRLIHLVAMRRAHMRR
jgi:hypothetical protein